MNARAVNMVSKPFYSSSDDEWICETKTFIKESYRHLKDNHYLQVEYPDAKEDGDYLNKIDIQDLAHLYEKSLYEARLDIEDQLSQLEQKVFNGLSEEDYIHKLNFEPNDSLVDLRIRFPEENSYINFLEKKQHEMKELQTKTEIDAEKIHAGKSYSKSRKTLKTKPLHSHETFQCQICTEECSTEDDSVSVCSVTTIIHTLI